MFGKRANEYIGILTALALIIFLSSCGKLNPNYLKSNFHFNKANLLFKDGKYRQAIEEYEATLKFNPNQTAAYRFLGESYKNLYVYGVDRPDNKERADRALAALNKALEINPTNKEIIYSLGEMYDRMRNFHEAEKFYLQILELEPTNMNNYYVVAEFYKRYAGEGEEVKKKAESMYLRRIEADPENAVGYAYAANYYENLPASADNIDQTIANVDKANEFWEKRIELDSNNPEAWLAKGVNRWSRSFRFQNRPANERLAIAKDSLRALEKARELAPDDPMPYLWLNILYRNVFANLEEDRKERHIAEADKLQTRFEELRKRAADKKRLEEELKRIK